MSVLSTLMVIFAVWFVVSAAVTFVWVTWRLRCQDREDRRTFQQVLRERDDDLDAELRALIEQHRT